MSLSRNSLVDALCMKGGKGEFSYDANSTYQRSIFSGVQHVVIDSVKETLKNLNFPEYIKLVDLGCSSGRNTFFAMSVIINTIIESYNQKNQTPPEIDCCLNDLLENDFNTVFKLVPQFHENIKKNAKEKCYVSGVPGSFYKRLFPNKSVHFIHSSLGVHWLSKVPEGLEKNTKSLHIGQECPPDICKSYLNQFKNDFTLLLKLRSEELVCNGQMVLTFIGRKVADSLSSDAFHVWSMLSDCLLELVSEGIVKESEMESFNFPFYNPNEEELREIIVKEGSFKINKIETTEHTTAYKIENDEKKSVQIIKASKEVATSMRSLVEPLFVAHFGEAVLEPLFVKYAHYTANFLSASSYRPNKTLNITVSLTRK